MFTSTGLTNGTLTVAPPPDHGGLTFNDSTGTIIAATMDAFAGLPVGARIAISGTGTNDGFYTITANDGTALTADPPPAAAEGTDSTPVVQLHTVGHGGLTLNAALWQDRLQCRQ